MKTYTFEKKATGLKLKVKFDFVKDKLKDVKVVTNNKLNHSFVFNNEHIITISDSELKLGHLYLYLDKKSSLARDIINDINFSETI